MEKQKNERTIYVLVVYGGEWDDRFETSAKATFNKSVALTWAREEEKIHDELRARIAPYRKEGYNVAEKKLKELSGGKYQSLSVFDNIDGFDVDEIPFE
jgi:hypothetical protein